MSTSNDEDERAGPQPSDLHANDRRTRGRVALRAGHLRRDLRTYRLAHAIEEALDIERGDALGEAMDLFAEYPDGSLPPAPPEAP